MNQAFAGIVEQFHRHRGDNEFSVGWVAKKPPISFVKLYLFRVAGYILKDLNAF